MLIKSFMVSFPQEHADQGFIDRFGKLVPPEISRWERMLNELSGLSSQAELRMSRVNVDELVANTLGMMSEKMSARKIEVVYSRQDKNLSLTADPQRLKQVLINLIMNAAGAMPDGGRLIISVGPASGDDMQNPQHIEIRIADTGSGIPPEAIGKIFEPFYTNRANGIGLGLAIARKITQQHGGDIAVASALGRGSAFIVTLPTGIPAPLSK
jgi:two-component system sensor histidine kinase HydH